MEVDQHNVGYYTHASTESQAWISEGERRDTAERVLYLYLYSVLSAVNLHQRSVASHTSEKRVDLSWVKSLNSKNERIIGHGNIEVDVEVRKRMDPLLKE